MGVSLKRWLAFMNADWPVCISLYKFHRDVLERDEMRLVDACHGFFAECIDELPRDIMLRGAQIRHQSTKSQRSDCSHHIYTPQNLLRKYFSWPYS